MSADATGHVIRWAPYKGADLLLLMMIADSVNDQNDNEFWMTAKNLAAKARVSRSTATSALRKFTDDGWLEADEPTIEEGRPTGRQGRYVFLFPESDEPVFETRRKRTENGRGVTGERLPGNRTAVTKTQEEHQEETNTDTTPAAPADEASLPYRLCAYLVKQMKVHKPDMKPVTITVTWVNDARLMLELDKREPHEIQRVIDWIFTDPAGAFWPANIRSPKKLRTQYDRLTIQMRQPTQQRSTIPAPATTDAPNPFLPDGGDNPAYAEWLNQQTDPTQGATT